MPANSNYQDDDNRLEDFSVGGQELKFRGSYGFQPGDLSGLDLNCLKGFPVEVFLKRDQPESNPHNDT